MAVSGQFSAVMMTGWMAWLHVFNAGPAMTIVNSVEILPFDQETKFTGFVIEATL
jgi:hypothetical protein